MGIFPARHSSAKNRSFLWWCSKPSQAITIVIWKWDELVRNFSVNSFLTALPLRRSFMCWMCRHLLDYISLPSGPLWGCMFLSIILTVSTSSPVPSPHRLLLCCKRPDCPLNVFFYITLHFFPFSSFSVAPRLIRLARRAHVEFSPENVLGLRLKPSNRSTKFPNRTFSRIFREFAAVLVERIFSPPREERESPAGT